ncbi:MAG TPA: redoxin domain-containing protein [Burkholderiales bacterium]|nr:redoxin domain-containing protein [Burkholderiales bacterium]
MNLFRGNITLCAILTACFLCAGAAAAAPEIGEPAPALKGKLFTGEDFDLAQMRGKVVLINYYSSYTKHNAMEIGNLEALLEALQDRGFEIIALGVDRPQDRERVERMLGIYNIKGAMAAELEENDFGIGLRATTSFLIDRKGIVRSRETGGKTPLYFRDFVMPLIDEPQ